MQRNKQAKQQPSTKIVLKSYTDISVFKKILSYSKIMIQNANQ